MFKMLTEKVADQRQKIFIFAQLVKTMFALSTVDGMLTCSIVKH